LGQKRAYFILNGVCLNNDVITDSDTCSRMATSMNIDFTTTDWSLQRENEWYPEGCSLERGRAGVKLVFNYGPSTAICRRNVLCICYGERSTDTEAYLLKSKRCPTYRFGAVTQNNCLARAQELGLSTTKNELKLMNKTGNKAKLFARPAGCFYNGKRVVYNPRNHPNQRCSRKYPCICLRTALDERSDPPILPSPGAYTSVSDPCPTPISTASECEAKAEALHLYKDRFQELNLPVDTKPEGCYKVERVLYWNPYTAGKLGTKTRCDDKWKMKCVCKGDKPTPPKPTRPPPRPRVLSGEDWNFV